MPGHLPARPFAWALAGWILAGELLFGATALPLGAAPGATRLDTRSLFAGVALALAAAVLLATPREERPSRTWCLALGALPAYLLLQLVPWPLAMTRLLSPAVAGLIGDVWPGPLRGCGGAELVSGVPGPLWPLTIDPVSTWRTFFRVSAAAAAFLAGAAYFRREGARAGRLCLAVALFVTLEAAYGLYEWRAATPHVLWRIKTAYVDCASGTLINRNHFAMLLYIGAACTIAVLAARMRRDRTPDDRGREMLVRALLALAIGLQLGAIVATKSRAGIAVSLVVLAPAVPYLLRRGAGEVRGVAALVLAILAVPIVTYVGPDFVGRLQQVPEEWTGVASRGAVLRLSLPIVARFPLLGTGGGTFEWIFPLYRSDRIFGRYDYAHNDYLQQLIETGVPGLLLALLPAVLFALLAWRNWRGEGRLPRAWPVWGALAAVAIHELVDFGLQIPAHTVLFGLLAGACLPRGPNRAAPRLASAWAWAALAAAPAGVLFSVAGWPGVAPRLTWPVIPESAYQRSADALERWSKAEEPRDPAPLCDAIDLAATAQSARPLSARFAAQQALLTLTALRTGVLDGEWALEQASRATALARRLDPWNAWIRERAMLASLELGEIGEAGEDARVAASRSASLARRIVRTLREAGLPATLIDEMVGDVPKAMESLVDSLFQAGAKEELAALFPADIAPSARHCAVAGSVRRVLRAVHRVDARPFLEGCLTEPSIREDDRAADLLRLYVAQEELQAGDAEAAERAIAEADPDRKFIRSMRLQIAEARGEWATVARIAHELLDEGRGTMQRRWEAWLRARLGKAYAQQGRIAEALRQYERAHTLDPLLPDGERIITDLRHGTNPFAQEPR